MSASSAIQARWEQAAWAIAGPVKGTRLPLHVLEEEAVATARFCRRYWKPRVAGGRQLPGLGELGSRGPLGPRPDEDLLELLAAFRAAEQQRRLIAPRPQAPAAESRVVLSELRAVLRFCVGGNPRARAQLSALSAAHGRARSHDALAAALFEYATLAKHHRGSIAGVGGFDPKVIEQAFDLCRELRESSAGPETLDPATDARRALQLRDRLVHLLEDRLRAVRSAARFVFREHPEVVREVTSQYKRDARERWRRGQNKG